MPLEPIVPAWSKIARPVIAMVHLRPLPGSPRYAGSMAEVIDAAVADAAALDAAGADGLMIENFGDAPFHAGPVPAETIAAMTAAALAVGERTALPLGINVLRNDGCGALGVAAAVGAAFVRVNILAGARLTDQGVIQGIAHALMRLRRRLGAEGIAVLADVNVKHSTPLGPMDVALEAADLIERALADALIVTGDATGSETGLEELRRVRAVAVAHGKPVLVGSGVTPENARRYAGEADGFIVGSALKRGGRAENAVDPERAGRLIGEIKNAIQ